MSDKEIFDALMVAIGKLRLSPLVGGGYSYNKDALWSVLNEFRCYTVMSDISNKESCYGSPWNAVEQDELLHSIENVSGFSTYYFSKKAYDECMRYAEASLEAMNDKAILDYSDKKNSERLVQQIALGISAKKEKEWHGPDVWAAKEWYWKVELRDDGHVCGDNMYFAEG